VTSVTDPLNRTTQLEWCRCGALQKLTDAKNQVTDWVYDIEGHLLQKKIDGSVVQTNTYDQWRGLLVSGTDALGQAKVYTYALDNQATNLQYQNEVNSTPDVTWQWDQRYSRVTAMTDGTGTTSYGYGAIGTTSANQLTSEILPVTSGSIGYTYDALQRLYRRQINGSANDLIWGRDEIGRIYGYVASDGAAFSGTVG